MTKPVTAFYGKVRIPTIGHGAAIEHLKNIAKKVGGSTSIGLSGTSHPLTPELKRRHAEKLFRHPVESEGEHTKNLFSYLAHLHGRGHNELHLVAGSDRAGEYQKVLERYNGKPDKQGKVHFNFKKWQVHSVPGERSESNKDPRKMTRPELTSSVSATKLEGLARSGNWEHFKAYHPGMSEKHVRSVYDHIRKSKSLTEEMSYEDFEPMVKSFADFAAGHLKLKELPPIKHKKPDDSSSFGGYNPNSKEIILQTKNRQPMDIFRTLAHELVHAKQHEDGKIGKDIAKEGSTGSPYENEANSVAGVIMRLYGKNNPDFFGLESLREAIFIVGGPCSGKDIIVKEILKESGAFEMDVAALARITPTEDQLVINAPAHDFETIRAANEMLKQLNYETSMIFVDVENNISKLRNEQRAVRGQRMLNENVRFAKLERSKENLEKFIEMFYDVFVVDNTDNTLNEGRCWKGYRPVKGKSAFAKGSCEKIRESLHAWFKSRSPKTGARGWVQVGGKYDGYPCARQPGQTSTPKCRSSAERSKMSKKEKEYAFRKKNRQDPNQPEKSGGAKPTMVKTYKEEKDACYHKVKSRYDVFPSAYASGALVKCRKVGAANWGSKSKKKVDEDFEKFMSNTYNREEGTTKLRKLYSKMTPGQDIVVNDDIGGPSILRNPLSEKKSEHKKKMKIVPKRLAQEAENNSKTAYVSTDIGVIGSGLGPTASLAASPSTIGGLVGSGTGAGVVSMGIPAAYGTSGYYSESVINWANKPETQDRFIRKYGDRAEQKLNETVNVILESIDENWEALGGRDSGIIAKQGKEIRGETMEEDSWSDTKYQNPKGGLTKAGVEKYRAENPGSKLQTAVRTPPSKLKKGSKKAKRRKSYCARSKGQMKMWPKAAKDPNSRLRKARRAWNCEE